MSAAHTSSPGRTAQTPAELEPRAMDVVPARVEILHPAPFWCRIRVRDEHNSRAINHVSNTEYVRWLDRAAELHADSWGMTRAAMLHTGVMWFVARHEIDYLAEAHAGDELWIATWVRDATRVKSWRDYVIVRLDSPKTSNAATVVCRASTLWVLVNLATRKPTRISAEMRAVMQCLDDSTNDGHLSRSTHHD